MRFISLHLLPWVAAGLAVVVIIVCLAAWRRRRAIRALSAAGGMVSNASPRRRIIRTAALLAACGLAAVAVLRPITGTILTDHSMPAKHLVVLLDVSKSMAAVDVNGLSRLEAAKLAIRELMNERAADQIGLVVFSGEAFVECPITRSRSIFINRLELAQPGMLPADGTSLAGGLRRALDLLGEHPPKGSSILLFSDGDNVSGDPLADLGDVLQRQVSVHTMAFGTPGVPAPLPAGLSRNPSATSAADPSLLADIATRTGGTAFSGDPAHLDATIARMMPAIDAVNVGGSDMAREFRERPIDVYAWPLGLAVGCLMLRFFLPLRTRQWHPLAAVAVMFMVCSAVASADEATPAPARYESALEVARAAQLPLVLAFTGSDWSDASIRCEREILSHDVYRTWAERNVVVLPVDMPRHSVEEEVRRQNRELVKQHHVTSYPTFVFIDSKDGKEMGRLGYDASGPASWVDRATAILRGDRSVSTSERSISKLPADTRAWLEDATIPAGERCARYYNEALTLETTASGKSALNKDRFALLEEILANANQLAGNNAALGFAPRMKLATLRHQLGLTHDPKRKPADTVALLEKAQLEYNSAAAMAPADDEDLTHNLAMVARDIEHARLVLAASKAYQRAVKLVELGNSIEQTFHQDLDNWITTATPVNDRRIDEVSEALDALVVAADASADPNKEKFRQAAAEIRNCPAPHVERALQSSAKVFQKVHDLLIPPQQQQQQQQGESQGEGESEGDEDGDKESTEPKQGAESPKGNADRNLSEQEENAALRSAADKNRGLRDQQLKELGRKAKPVPPEQDR